MLQDNAERYGTITRVFHWLVALLVIWQFLKFGDRIADGEHWIGQTLVPWHISIGSLLLLLIGGRIVWALSQVAHRPSHEPPLDRLANAGHVLLYITMALMPITGVCYMIGEGHGLDPFGMVLVAEGDEIPWLASIGGLHSWIAWAFLALVIGHIGMAFHHHFGKQDDTLRRMVS